MECKPAPWEKASRERCRSDELLVRARARTCVELARYPPPPTPVPPWRHSPP